MLKLLFITAFLNVFTPSSLQQEQKDSMTVSELKNKLENKSDIVVLDVRTPEELAGPLGKINEVINIPIQELEKRIGELEKYKDKEIAVICRSGVRSAKGTKILNENGFKAKNVLGGMIEYRQFKKE
jgi:rhodanese-related sulfurtransferase